jgi:hypothetical protein
VPFTPPLKKVLTPFVMCAAVLYFVLDALFLSIIRPVSRALAKLGLFARLADAIAALGPYTTLAFFLVPLVLLEPAKPAGLYLMAEGRFFRGIVLIAGAELLKIAIVERIYHIGRPKLMTIPAFARAHDFVAGWLDWFKALPAWQAVMHRFRSIAKWSRSLARRNRSSSR